MKSTALILLIFIEIAFGYISLKSRGIGAAKNLRGKPLPYIHGGEIVQGREFPGMVSLQFQGNHMYGGSIINEKYIVTTSQASGFLLKVLSGTNHWNQSGTLHDVKVVYVHKKDNQSDSWHNDIAVMEVDPPFVFDEGTSPVKLPPKGQQTIVGKKATVIGWGLIEGIEFSNDLRKADIFISDHDECKEVYESIGLTVYPEEICTDTPEGKIGPCFADQGGPLFVDGEVVGLVSWASGCSERRFPAVYIGVSNYIDWINSKINS